MPLFIGLYSLGFNPHDFETNGVLLPCTAQAAIVHRLPLHRGPHRQYNEMVADRFGILMRTHLPCPDNLLHRFDALAAVHLLQRGLKRGLLQKPGFIRLNRRDVLSRTIDFRELDKEVELLWRATEI